MAEVKWIKIVTDIFDDEKIKYIETMPNGDTIIVIWFRLLCLAGKSNANGLLMMTDKIAYTDDMLASIFNRDKKVIEFALITFEKLGMVEILENQIAIANWNKHQNVRGLEEIRESDRLRKQKSREKKKLIELEIGNECHEDVTGQSQDMSRLSSLSISLSNSESLSLIKEEKKKNYGEFQNVKLTDEEYEKVVSQNLTNMIERLSTYLASSGKRYKSHYATILSWHRKDEEKEGKREINPRTATITSRTRPDERYTVGSDGIKRDKYGLEIL